MEITTEFKDKADDIIEMFSDTFTASEGPEAGELIKDLVADMLSSLTSTEMRVFTAVENTVVLASIIFTRMDYPDDDRTIFILAPVAVSTSQQGKGLGQRLITHAIQTLREDGVDVALTYGDVKFYSKIGFAQITVSKAQPPLPLQYPEGWLGQSLTSKTLTPLKGPSRCVGPLYDPAHW